MGFDFQCHTPCGGNQEPASGFSTDIGGERLSAAEQPLRS
jgi:hypothetical protein